MYTLIYTNQRGAGIMRTLPNAKEVVVALKRLERQRILAHVMLAGTIRVVGGTVPTDGVNPWNYWFDQDVRE